MTSFEHAAGTIQKIDQHFRTVARGARFCEGADHHHHAAEVPGLAEAATQLKGTRFAVIADEAYSSQTGEAAKDLKAVLTGLHGDAALGAAEQIDKEPDPQDLLAKSVEARGRQDNLSFFAFTATPKQKTMELFGEKVPAPEVPAGFKYVPFHLYSMRQAIRRGSMFTIW